MAYEVFPPILNRRTSVAAAIFFGLSIALILYRKTKKEAFAPPVVVAADTTSLKPGIPFSDTTLRGLIYEHYLVDSTVHAYGYAVLFPRTGGAAMSRVYKLLHIPGMPYSHTADSLASF